MMAQINVDKVINDEPLGRFRFLLIVLVSATVIIDGFDIQMIAFVSPVLIETWGVTKAELALAVSAALAGMAIGAPIGGWIGDKWGRRTAMIFSAGFFGLATLPVALATNVPQLAMLRFVAGLGFGAVLPNATALIAEWMPARLRSFMISLMIVGIPVGGLLGASASGWLIENFGWQGGFWAAGILALILTGVLYAFLPESPKFLVRNSPDGRAVAPLLQAAFGKMRFSDSGCYVIEDQARTDWKAIFAPGLLRTTIGMTLAFFASLLVFYGFANWLPIMLTAKGMTLQVALKAAMHFNLSGFVGALVVAAAVSKLGSKVALLGALLGGIGASFGLGSILSVDQMSVPLAMAATVIAGACLSGLQVGLYALAASVYPTDCRSTGVGFAAGIGRLGPIVSAAVGGILLDMPQGSFWLLSSAAAMLGFAIIGILVVKGHSRPI